MDILNTVEELRKARKEELAKGNVYAEEKAKGSAIEAEIGAREKKITADAYAEGKIEGKNADERKGSELRLIVNDPAIIRLMDELKECVDKQRVLANEYELAKVERRYNEDLLSAQRTILYASGDLRDGD